MIKYLRILCLGLCLVLLLSAIGCTDKPSDSSSETGSAVSSASKRTASKTNSVFTATYFSTDVWKAVPMVNKAQKDAGVIGGEGCQWSLDIEFDPIDGKTAFFGTDVGGIYKSEDSGKTWTPKTIGMISCGGTGFCIDPNNIDHVISVGCNSAASDKNGLYLSTDGGDTWKQVYSARIGGYRDYRRQVAFDPTTKDGDKGSKVAYWSRESDNYGAGNAELAPGLYKSENGGESWKLIPNSSDYGGAEIAVDSKTGALYIGAAKGFFKSTDGGKTFKKIVSGAVRGMDCHYRRPGHVYIALADGVYASSDGGDSFNKINGQYNFSSPSYLRVSPADPNYMMMQNYTGDDSSKLYFSHDGGKTWTMSDRDNSSNYRWPSNSWIPYNVRQNPCAFHPKDKNIVLTLGGDFVMRSTDGGAHFKWSNSGYNGMMTGGLAVFNVNDPDLIINPSQDYNGGYSTDGGSTWNYIEWYADWGGFTYGGYALSESTVFVGLKDGMNSYGGGNDVHYLAITFDGGKTKTVRKDIVITGADVGMGVPGDNNVAFMGEWRTADGGKTWAKMKNCVGVFTCNTKDGTLYGSSGYDLVRSTDKGITWEKIATAGSRISDIAFNPETDTAYVLAGSLWAIDIKNHKRQDLRVGGNSVAVDPSRPEIVYIAATNGLEQHQTAVKRSLDGGKTWTNLCRTPGDGREGPDGGKQATSIRVNPKTGAILVATCCRGMWTMPAPPKK